MNKTPKTTRYCSFSALDIFSAVCFHWPQMSGNLLFYGDNLPVLRNRKYFPDESVDLVYLDPPFNSNADYNILFREQGGEPAQAQIKAFTDTWQWSELTYQTFIESTTNQMLADLIQGFVKTLGRNEVTAYLVMMAPRLEELYRVLKPIQGYFSENIWNTT